MKRIDFTTDNVGGLAYIYAIPPACLVRIRHDYVTGNDIPEFRAREHIIQLPIYPGVAYKWDEIQTLEAAGELFTVSITGLIPANGGKEHPVIRILERGEWLVLHLDANGVCRLSGTVEVPLRFVSSKTSGDTPATLNTTSFVFSAKEAEQSIVCSLENIDNI